MEKPISYHRHYNRLAELTGRCLSPASPPPPGPPNEGETETDYKSRIEQEMIARWSPSSKGFWPKGAWFQIVRRLKGDGRDRTFLLKPLTLDSCEYPGNGSALDGQTGDEFVFFISDGRPGTKTVINSIEVNRGSQKWIMSNELRAMVSE